EGGVGEESGLRGGVDPGRLRVRQNGPEVLARQVAAGELAAARRRHARQRQERGRHVDVARQRLAGLSALDIRVDDDERDVDRLLVSKRSLSAQAVGPPPFPLLSAETAYLPLPPPHT